MPEGVAMRTTGVCSKAMAMGPAGLFGRDSLTARGVDPFDEIEERPRGVALRDEDDESVSFSRGVQGCGAVPQSTWSRSWR